MRKTMLAEMKNLNNVNMMLYPKDSCVLKVELENFNIYSGRLELNVEELVKLYLAENKDNFKITGCIGTNEDFLDVVIVYAGNKAMVKFNNDSNRLFRIANWDLFKSNLMDLAAEAYMLLSVREI